MMCLFMAYPPYPPPFPSPALTVLKQLYFDQLKEAFAKFDRSEEIDDAVQNAFAEAVRNDEISSLRVAEESRIIEEALQYLDAGKEEGAQWKRIRSSLNQPVEKFKRKVAGKNVSEGWGKAAATIHASSEIVLSYLWLLDSHKRTMQHIRKNGKLIRRVVYLPNTRTQLSDIGKEFPGIATNRLFSMRSVWGKVEDDDGSLLVIAGKPRKINSEALEAIELQCGRMTQATCHQGFLIKKIATNVCRVTYAGNVGVGGSIPKSMMDRNTKKQLDLVTDLYETFERRGRDVDAEVSWFLGWVGS